MTELSQQEQAFMLELHTATGGDPETQASMYEVGAAAGLDKNAATAMSQDLMVEELVELKTLSGGIGITAKGLATLAGQGLIASLGPPAARLGKGPLLDDGDHKEIDALLGELKAAIYSGSNSFQQLAELVIATKTLEVQLLSPRPKTAIVRPILNDIAVSLKTQGQKDLAEMFSTFAAD